MPRLLIDPSLGLSLALVAYEGLMKQAIPVNSKKLSARFSHDIGHVADCMIRKCNILLGVFEVFFDSFDAWLAAPKLEIAG